MSTAATGGARWWGDTAAQWADGRPACVNVYEGRGNGVVQSTAQTPIALEWLRTVLSETFISISSAAHPADSQIGVVSTTRAEPTQEERAQRAIRLLDSWLDGDEEEQRETWAYLKKVLDEDRLSDRKLFP